MRNQFTLRKWNARAKHDVIKHLHPVFPGDYSVLEPPEPMPNSEVKRNSVDDSVGFPCESRTSPGPNLKIIIQTNSKNLLSDNSVLDPPDSMPNSEVKRNSVDDSVGFPCESRTSLGTKS